MAVQPFSGTQRQFWDENGWRHVVHAQAGRWELRELVDQIPPRWIIASKLSLLASEAHVDQTTSGFEVVGVHASVAKHAPFANPIEAFHWWVGEKVALPD